MSATTEPPIDHRNLVTELARREREKQRAQWPRKRVIRVYLIGGFLGLLLLAALWWMDARWGGLGLLLSLAITGGLYAAISEGSG